MASTRIISKLFFRRIETGELIHLNLAEEYGCPIEVERAINNGTIHLYECIESTQVINAKPNKQEEQKNKGIGVIASHRPPITGEDFNLAAKNMYQKRCWFKSYKEIGPKKFVLALLESAASSGVGEAQDTLKAIEIADQRRASPMRISPSTVAMSTNTSPDSATRMVTILEEAGQEQRNNRSI